MDDLTISEWWHIANEVVFDHLNCEKCVSTWPLCFKDYRNEKLIATVKGLPFQYRVGNPFTITCLETKLYWVESAIAAVDAKNLPKDEQLAAIMVLVDRWLERDHKAKRIDMVRRIINGK